MLFDLQLLLRPDRPFIVSMRLLNSSDSACSLDDVITWYHFQNNNLYIFWNEFLLYLHNVPECRWMRNSLWICISNTNCSVNSRSCTNYTFWDFMGSSQFEMGIYIIYHLSGGHVTDTDTNKWYLMSFPFSKNCESAPSWSGTSRKLICINHDGKRCMRLNLR